MKIGTTLAARMLMGALGVIALALAFLPSSAARAEPELREVTPPDGSVLEAAPEVVRLCYSEALKQEKEEWRFNVRVPGGRALGLRIVFGSDSTCVDVFPGAGEDPPEGIWSLEWLVHAQSDGSERSGVVRFQVGDLQPGETPLPEPRETSEPNNDDDTPTALIALAVVGAAFVVLAAIGFTVRRIRRRRGVS
jgi:hypothetical protein